MARIKEFAGLRPQKELAELMAELPYDVGTDSEVRAAANKNKYSFYHISRPEVDFPENTNIYDKSVYEKGRDNFLRFIKDGYLVDDRTENLYLYTLIMEGRSQTGLVSCVHVDDYKNNIIKKHELVLDSKVEDRKKYIELLNANTGLVYLFYKENSSKKALFKDACSIQPEYDFTSKDGIRHIFRVISDPVMIKKFKVAFKDDIFYIADGHHRTYAAYKAGLERSATNPGHNGEEEYNWFPAVIFPHDELYIMPYNRVVADLNGNSPDAFMKRLENQYNIETVNINAKKHEIRMYLKGRWHKLLPKFGIEDHPVKSLDVQILQDTILSPLLNILDPRKDKRIDFIGGIRGEQELERLVDSGRFIVAFSLMPVSIHELIRVADENELMLPKSTWFEPKLRSGLVIHRF